MKKFFIIAILLTLNLSCYGSIRNKGKETNEMQEVVGNEIIIESQITEEKSEAELIENEVMEQAEQEEKAKGVEQKIEKNKDANNNDKKVAKESTPKESNIQIQTNEINAVQETEKRETNEKQNKNADVETIEKKKLECTNNQHFMDIGNSKKWFNSDQEAIAYYRAEVKKWSDKLTNNEVSDEEYNANCPSGYEKWNCICGKCTINFYYR